MVVEGPPAPRLLNRDLTRWRALAGADLLSAALALATIALLGASPTPASLVLLPLVVLMSKVGGLYDRDEYLLRTTTLEEAPRLLQIVLTFGLLLWIGQSAFMADDLSREAIVAVLGVLLVAMLLSRKGARHLARRLTPPERCLVLGDDGTATWMSESVVTSHPVNARVVGRVPLEAGQAGHSGAPVLGSLRTLGSVLQRHRIDRVVIAPRRADSDQILDAIRLAKSLGMKVSVLPRLFEAVGSTVEFEDVDGLTLLGLRRDALTPSSVALKRAVDVALASVALLLLWPLLLAIAIGIRLSSPGPVLVRRRRRGAGGAVFDMLEFRIEPVGGAGSTQPAASRAGALVRRASLHELPRLLNVLRGDMTLVGPLPATVDDDRQADGLHDRRLHLTPGVTGTWRTVGRGRITAAEMTKMDYLYGASWSLWLDARVLARTAADALRGRRGRTHAPPVPAPDQASGAVDALAGDALRVAEGEGLVVTESPPPAAAAVAAVEAALRDRRAAPRPATSARRPALGSLTLTVIVPGTNAPVTIDRCTEAIRAAESPADELIVAEQAPNVGPAGARNYAAARATGDVLVFVDADVIVHEDALSRIRSAFEADPELTALFGAYDGGPAPLGRVGSFRNLLHHHVHTSCPGPARTFWTGLGAIRREAFLAAGGFDADRFRSPSVEDIELGMRLSAAGARIVLDPGVSGTHLKDWTVREMVETDFAKRGVPWVALLLASRKAPDAALNLGWRHRVSAAASLAGLLATFRRSPVGIVSCLLALLGLNRGFYLLLLRRHGAATAAAGFGLHLLHHLVSAAAVPGGLVSHLLQRRRAARSAASD